MKVKLHRLSRHLSETTNATPIPITGFSLSQSPVPGDFPAGPDPVQLPDLNNRDFQHCAMPLQTPVDGPAA